MDYSELPRNENSKPTKRNMMIKYIVIPFLFLLICSTIALWYTVVEDYAVEPEVWDILPDDALAPHIRPTDLILRPVSSGSELYQVPKYIHQSWMSDSLPEKMTRWSQTCRVQHRHWQWILWTDEDNLKMVETYFPWFLNAYRALPAEINRADASRNMYMYMFGGVYADLDTECLQPFDGLFNQHHYVQLTDDGSPLRSEQVPANMSDSQVAFFGRMGFDGTDITLEHTIPNAWMAASPGHPFFLLVLERLRQAVEANQKDEYKTTAEDLTGPIALYRGIEEYNAMLNSGLSFADHFASNPSYHLFNRPSQRLRMEVFPPVNIYPYAWNNQGIPFRKICWAGSKRFNSMKCKQAVTTNQSYAITYWSHTWNSDLHQEHNKHNMDAVGKRTGV